MYTLETQEEEEEEEEEAAVVQCVAQWGPKKWCVRRLPKSVAVGLTLVALISSHCD